MDIIIDEIIILKVLKNNFFCKSKILLFFKKYRKIKTPIHEEIEVDNGIIRKPTLLKKVILIVTFKNTMNEEI